MNFYKDNILDKNGYYVIYDRKSRVDIELERIKKMDTLQLHQELINRRVDELNIKVSKSYRELVSGETIQDRPEMQKLLKEIETGNIDGVIVVDIDRLSRGDTKDQGTVAQTFKYTNTKIITLNKIYDPTNEDDEDFFEFSLFMSRREYKTINKRMQRGRLTNVMNGKYCGGKAPFGYKTVKLTNMRGYTLEPDEKLAPIVKQIFEKRANGIEKYKICDWLDSIGITTLEGNEWTNDAISNIISNPTYLGKIRWFKRKTKKMVENGIIKKKMVVCDGEIYEGLHQAIVDEDTFYKANSNNKKMIRLKNSYELKNSIAGLIRCTNCKKILIMKKGNLNKKDLNRTIIKRIGNIDKEYIQKVLYNSFIQSGKTITNIAKQAKLPRGTVDSWFKKDLKKFFVPTYNNWIIIKNILNIADKKCIDQLENITKQPLKIPPDLMICTTRKCKCASTHVEELEKYIIEDAKKYILQKSEVLEQYKKNDKVLNDNQIEIERINKQLNKLQKQLDVAYELVEQQIYSGLEFKQRTDIIKKEIKKNNLKLKQIENEKKQFDTSLIPKYKELIHDYYNIKTVKEKNDLLKTIISHIDYYRASKNDEPFISIHYKI